ncbi:9d797eeb-4aa2-4bf2-87c4-a7afad22ca17 [Thermothielavioides terrestris]|uniref:9d797eeb-4aa2-4bf2-87c4-a7afad22ca17 n=1 Tax=Thermothielavioides terrestris TaxID=2587410 RepID=A0A3S4C0E3_9PEZI|nr:9d797eeb-4aa2-4bf2-87c4-a7afad22ca17 [Thermothielavioides terrestris]
MYLKGALLFSLLASSLAAPTANGDRKVKRGVLTVQDYSEFQVSDGVAGNALAEVNAKFPIDQSDLASVDAQDLAIIKAARETAEAAETDEGGFNDAIKAAGGTSTAAGKALQNGKIKNKVLKLQLEIAEEQKKLDTNIKLDQAAAGQPSQSVDFQGSDQP